MKTNKFSQAILTVDEAIQCLYNDNSFDQIDNANEAELFNKSTTFFTNIPQLNQKTLLSVEEFHKQNQNNWFIPDNVLAIDIENYLLSLCVTEEETNRVTDELTLFKEKNMLIILKLLYFLVDIFRKNNVVWGVGRGSSVSSYCLFLLGVHKVDSIKYKLDISEFIRDV